MLCCGPRCAFFTLTYGNEGSWKVSRGSTSRSRRRFMFFSSMLSSGSWSWGRRTTLIGSGHSRLLKILHVDPERNWGGGEAQVVGLLTYLIGKGHDNTLLAHPHGPLFEHCGNLNIKRLPLFLRNALDLRPVASLRRLICAGNYDIVH